MQLTDRFFDFTDQQLADLTAKEGIQHLGLYVSAPPNQQGPPLLLIRQWSANERSLPPADADPNLRLPHESRRWYPLQDAGLILGALRADLDQTGILEGIPAPSLVWQAQVRVGVGRRERPFIGRPLPDQQQGRALLIGWRTDVEPQMLNAFFGGQISQLLISELEESIGELHQIRPVNSGVWASLRQGDLKNLGKVLRSSYRPRRCSL